DALLLGRTTDELFAAYWPQVTDPDNGSHVLVQTLHDAGLVDEYRVIVAPVVVGSGKRLFEAGRVPTGFELVTTEQTATGCQYMVLRPAGGLEVATATVEDGRDVVR
ncbi:MAG: dihydrofolate reductase family protein, partial [Lapillicoccus sp.]